MKYMKEKFKTWGNVFDQFTLRNVFKLASEGHFLELKSPISIGKESNVFSATTEDGGRVIVKIYRLEACDFNRMYDYIKFDPRFVSLKPSKRRVILAWVRREYKNLLKAREGGVKVPKPLAVLHNILVEEFIGDEDAASKLKDEIPQDPEKFFLKTLDNMKKLYAAGLVHADLSHFNILNYDEMPVFIDFSQSTPLANPNAEEYLVRDVRNVCNFFRKIGLKCEDAKVLEEIRKAGKNRE